MRNIEGIFVLPIALIVIILMLIYAQIKFVWELIKNEQD